MRRILIPSVCALALSALQPCEAQLPAPTALTTVLAPQGKRKKKPKIKPQVAYAQSWEAAVEEAKLLKLPLVVHSHGFN